MVSWRAPARMPLSLDQRYMYERGLAASPRTAARPDTKVGKSLTSYTAHFVGFFMAYTKQSVRLSKL